MSDARRGDPREYGARDRDDERTRVYDERDRDDQDPRDGLIHDLDLPRGEERELVVDRDRAYELNGEDGRTLAAVGTFESCPSKTSISMRAQPIISETRGSSRPSILGTTSVVSP